MMFWVALGALSCLSGSLSSRKSRKSKNVKIAKNVLVASKLMNQHGLGQENDEIWSVCARDHEIHMLQPQNHEHKGRKQSDFGPFVYAALDPCSPSSRFGQGKNTMASGMLPVSCHEYLLRAACLSEPVLTPKTHCDPKTFKQGYPRCSRQCMLRSGPGRSEHAKASRVPPMYGHRRP